MIVRRLRRPATEHAKGYTAGGDWGIVRSRRLNLGPLARPQFAMPLPTRLPFFFLAILAVLGGCASAPPPKVIDPPAAFSGGGEVGLEDAWWAAFGDRRLDELVATALSGNLSLAAARERVAQAEWAAARAGANRYPSLDGNFTGSRKRVVAGDGVDVDAYRAQAALSQDIDLWNRLGALAQAADFQARAAAESYRQAGLALAGEVSRTWFQLAESQEKETLLQGQIGTTGKMLEAVRFRYIAGKSRSSDVLQQERQLESLKGDLINAQADSASYARKLQALLGRSATEPLVETARLPASPPLPATGLPSTLLARNPAVHAAFLNLQAADAQAAAAVAAQYPVLNLSLPVESASAAWGGLFDVWTAGLAASLAGPILDAGRRAADVEKAAAATREAAATYGQTLMDTVFAVENALVREARQRDYVANLETQEDLARKAFERIIAQYAKGSASYLDALVGLNTMQALQRGVITARRVQLGYRIDLYMALGSGLSAADLARASTLNLAQRTP